MIDLLFDSDDPLDCFDNPTCFFNDDGDGLRREPGDPGYLPWSPPGPEPTPFPDQTQTQTPPP